MSGITLAELYTPNRPFTGSYGGSRNQLDEEGKLVLVYPRLTDEGAPTYHIMNTGPLVGLPHGTAFYVADSPVAQTLIHELTEHIRTTRAYPNWLPPEPITAVAWVSEENAAQSYFGDGYLGAWFTSQEEPFTDFTDDRWHPAQWYTEQAKGQPWRLTLAHEPNSVTIRLAGLDPAVEDDAGKWTVIGTYHALIQIARASREYYESVNSFSRYETPMRFSRTRGGALIWKSIRWIGGNEFNLAVLKPNTHV